MAGVGPLAWGSLVLFVVAFAGSCQEPEAVIARCAADPESECAQGADCAAGFACDAERCICENLACFGDALARCSSDLDCPDSSCNLIACRCETEVNAGLPPAPRPPATGGAGGRGGQGGSVGEGGARSGAGGGGAAGGAGGRGGGVLVGTGGKGGGLPVGVGGRGGAGPGPGGAGGQGGAGGLSL